ncbi:hypothetical protein AXK12_06340 [Cephaloticoccus capnophilus]|uniref:Glycosyltransferase RgtA/B/C/D-like domain-containing protein n=2 Tax=Cephaloticoccus capnophilus TaxID=1548208 RepID=A0A139SJZ2_9BACT|nr:hypothetical protein AXK12_06340 [Cephaloticoccus capnophilus]
MQIGRVARLLLLVATVCVVWLTIENRWGSNFQLPTRYAYDAHYVLGMMKLAQEGDLGLFSHIYTKSLGAPFVGQLNDFPQTERVIIWVGGQVARVVGLMPAANAMLILSCVLAALSFYLSARLWKINRVPAWVFAVTYAFLPHNSRSIQHLGIIFTGLLPLQFYILWYVSAAQKLSWRSRRFRLTLVVSLLSGLLNIYWIFFFLQLYVLALLFRIIKRSRDFTKALIPFAITCLSAGVFLGSFIIYRISYGDNAMAVVRSYADIEQWALKPIDLFLPKTPPPLPIVSTVLSRYYDGGMIKIGENFGSYIGLFAALGLLALLFKSSQRQISRKSISLPCLAAIWIIAYTAFGGLHSVFSLVFDFYEIRATNRYSTAIATIGLLYFVFISHKLTRKWNPTLRLFFLGVGAVCGLLEQSWSAYRTPSPPPALYEVADYVKADKALVSRLEHGLEPGSMIYILPATDFPEPFWGRGKFKGDFHHYQAMRPFLYSTKLRYSYGSNKGRQGADWQLDVQELAPRGMAATLESYGFAGILLNRKGYEDRGEQVLAELARAGWPMEFEQGVDNEWVFIRLTPEQNPVLPTPTPYALTPQN